MSRTAFIVGVALAALVLQVATSQAQSKSKSRSNASSAIGVLAKSKDPAGTYASYPDWARFALAPGSGRGR